MADELGTAIREATRERRTRRDETFHALMEERFRHLEAQVHEVKGRVNGLIFLVLGAVAAEFVLRLVQ